MVVMSLLHPRATSDPPVWRSQGEEAPRGARRGQVLGWGLGEQGAVGRSCVAGWVGAVRRSTGKLAQYRQG